MQTNDVRNRPGCTYAIMEKPQCRVCKPAIGDEPQQSGSVFSWSSDLPIPAIGEHIIARVRDRSEAMQVVSYFIEYGWVGLECQSHEDDGTRPRYVFGCDLVPLEGEVTR